MKKTTKKKKKKKNTIQTKDQKHYRQNVYLRW